MASRKFEAGLERLVLQSTSTPRTGLDGRWTQEGKGIEITKLRLHHIVTAGRTSRLVLATRGHRAEVRSKCIEQIYVYKQANKFKSKQGKSEAAEGGETDLKTRCADALLCNDDLQRCLSKQWYSMKPKKAQNSTRNSAPGCSSARMLNSNLYSYLNTHMPLVRKAW